MPRTIEIELLSIQQRLELSQFQSKDEIKDMSNHHLFGRSSLPEEKNLIALSETQPIKGKLEDSSLQIDDVNTNSLILILSILLAILRLFWVLSKFKLTDKRLSIQRFTQIPCRDCRFLANNQYLNCAVHPSKVLTAQAVNCTDYCSKHKPY